jgi:hypothetical protein
MCSYSRHKNVEGYAKVQIAKWICMFAPMNTLMIMWNGVVIYARAYLMMLDD